MRFFKIVLGILILGGFNQTWAANPVGKIGFIRGDVLIANKQVSNGQAVLVGDIIQTKNGKCTILFGKESVVHLDSNSALNVSQYLTSKHGEQGVWILEKGRVRALFQGHEVPTKATRFRVRTRAAVLGVRGTHVYAESFEDPQKPDRFITIEGVADVQFVHTKPGQLTSRQPLMLTQNQSIQIAVAVADAARAVAPQITALTSETVKELAREVALPPVEIQTGGELNQFETNPIKFTEQKGKASHKEIEQAIELPDDYLNLNPTYYEYLVPVRVSFDPN